MSSAENTPQQTDNSTKKTAFVGLVDWRRLADWLFRDGVITQKEHQRTVTRCAQAPSTQHAVVRFAALGIERASDKKQLDAEELTMFLAGRAGLPHLRIDPLRVDVGKVAEAMSANYAERHKILPVQVTASEVVVATAQPFDTDWIPEVERQTRKAVRLVVSNPQDIARFTIEFYTLARSVRAAIKTGAGSNNALVNFEQLVELGKGGKSLDANDQGVVQLVDWIWQYAFDQRASDIHLEPRREQAAVRFRIDGVLHTVYQLPLSVLTAMTARIKLLAREKLVMRIFDPESAVKTLEQLGFSARDSERWEQLTSRPNGIILVTGPTGSGKTTTLYSTLKRLATEAVNIATIEDPIEMIEPAFNQTQAQAHLDFGFAEGVRTLMRQDPDIIMVGEIRDLETAEMAIQAALTGHLVFSTLHTNDAPSAIPRLIELGVPPYLLNASMLGVLAQRLVRSLCRECRVKDEDGEQQKLLAEAVKPWSINAEYNGYRPVGCLDCRMTGYRGRVGIYELLTVSEAFKELVHEKPDMDALRAQAIKDGMRPLRLAGSLRVADGSTTVSELLATTPAAPTLRRSPKQH